MAIKEDKCDLENDINKMKDTISRVNQEDYNMTIKDKILMLIIIVLEFTSLLVMIEWYLLQLKFANLSRIDIININDTMKKEFF